MAEDLVSKARTKQTKIREKRVTRTSSFRKPLKENPWIGLLIGFVLWLSAVFVLELQRIAPPDCGLDTVLPVAGHAAFVLAGLFAAGLFLRIVRPAILHQNPRLLLLALISLLALVPAKSLIYLAENTTVLDVRVAGFLLPFALAPLLTTILIDSKVGIAIGVWTGMTLAIAAGDSFPLFATSVVATVITGVLANNVRKRSNVFKTGLVVGLAQLICVFGLTALNWADSSMSIRLVLYQAAACLIGGLAAAIITLLILPLFETIFRITTDITLLELSDLGHPILQRLAIEAPGTYHHSLVVANLAQGACDQIGANSLLARISSYFHDIGKLTKPEFFAENIMHRDNPHDALPPSMSTLVIISHVKEGLSLAMHYKLPDPILCVIKEHHGTSLLSYFHHKAKSQLELALNEPEKTSSNGHSKINEIDFRYPGPRPSSRESAIVCLADAVEAASRTMEKTTPGHIEGLIRDIVNTRFEDGQLDHCELTMAELARVKRSFIFTLTNMLHGRVPYPKDENRDKQQTKSSATKPAKTQDSRKTPDEPS